MNQYRLLGSETVFDECVCLGEILRYIFPRHVVDRDDQILEDLATSERAHCCQKARQRRYLGVGRFDIVGDAYNMRDAQPLKHVLVTCTVPVAQEQPREDQIRLGVPIDQRLGRRWHIEQVVARYI